MVAILNLALKKDVFESLQNGSTNTILIEKTNWWKKRLMDIDTGRFKQFDVACVSSGSSEKINYDIESIELNDDTFIITLKTVPSVVIEPTVINPVVVEPEEVKAEVIEDPVVEPKDDSYTVVNPNVDKPVVDEEEVEESPKESKDDTTDDKDVREVVGNLFNKFCELNDVYVVNMPNVTIRNNGQIFGCKRRLIADRESDVKFDFVKKEFIKYPNQNNSSFALQVMAYLNGLLKNNFVFVNKNACGFRDGDLGNVIFTIVAIGKRKYLFGR